MRIAVIGSGISGLGAAWLLGQAGDVTLLENDTRIGGHSNTVMASLPDGSCPVDTGFIVYNVGAYPNLVALFDRLNVPTAATSMSFAASLGDGAIEYNGNGLGGLFAQRSNLFRPSHWSMARDILRFFREARDLGGLADDIDTSLGDFLDAGRYGAAFRERFVLPMGAAIWSTPARDMLDFPVAAFARFFENHGLLQVAPRCDWRTVVGGSREYVRRLLDDVSVRVVTGAGVRGVRRDGDGVTVFRDGGVAERYDRGVIACHGDQALALLTDADDMERNLLSAFRYARNDAILHRDARLMPRRRGLWASWNYIDGPDSARVGVSYWMNSLQPLDTRHDVFVTLNAPIAPDESLVLARMSYQHPMFDRAAMAAQRDLWQLQGRGGVWLAGSYFGYGFHEDGLESGLAAAEDLAGVRRPWTVPDGSSRIGRPTAVTPGQAGKRGRDGVKVAAE